ncbi:hypothetical protein R3P38DRAFT_1275926 [Favolaschia claudopus]|uniref:Velvet domain-containing protein n=1 Tax=Favolaschia claudopus TaxID=2862362 RepID=A0AAW0AYZ2_9AGAR
MAVWMGPQPNPAMLWVFNFGCSSNGMMVRTFSPCRRHELVVRQMPVEARASMRGKPGSFFRVCSTTSSLNSSVALDRRTLDPVPIVELRLFQRSTAAGFDQRIDVPLYMLTGYALRVALIDDESDEKVDESDEKVE